MKDPKITMDTVRVALNLLGDGAHANGEIMEAIRDSAKLGQIAGRIERLNEDDCNLGSGDDARDRKRDRLVAKGQGIVSQYGAAFHPYGEGGGLWPHIKLAGGGTVTP